MLPHPAPSILADNPNFANLYNHLTTNILAPNGSTIANAAEHDAISTQLNAARASALQDELLLRVLEEIASTLPGSTTDESISRSSQLPRKAGISTTSATLHQTSTKSNSLTNLSPEIRGLIVNVAAYLSTSIHADPTHPLPSDTEDLLADNLSTFQATLPTIAPLLSTHLINTERTLSSLTTPPTQTAPPTSQSLTSTPTKASRSRQKQQQSTPLSIALSTLHTSTNQLASETLPSTLKDTSTSLTSLLTSHQLTTTSRIRNLELQIHGTQSRYALARSTYLYTVAKGIESKSRIMVLEREKSVYGDEEILEKMEEEVERLGAEEGRLEGRERELLGLLGEYEEEGGKVGGRVGRTEMENGAGEEVFRVLGGRYKEVEREIETVKRDIERLETRVWRGR